MKQDCYRIEELGEIAELPGDDPRRSHLAECAHCLAMLAAVREFRNPSAVPEGARTRAAAVRLRSIVDQRLRLGEMPAGGCGDPPRWSGERHPHPFLRSMLWKPALRPVWGLAAACLVAAGVLSVFRHQGEISGPIVTREARTEAAVALNLHAPQALAADQVRLSWEPVAEADGYEILLLDVDLTVRARLQAQREPAVTVEGAWLRALTGEQQPVLWQVRALRGGDELLHSPPERLPVP